MATTTSKSSTPTFEFPTFDQGAFAPLMKEFIAAAAKTQRVLLDASETMMLRQLKLSGELLEKAQAAMVNFDMGKKPEAYFEEAKATAERMQAVAKENVDTGIKAQSEVADIVSHQLSETVEEVGKAAK